MTQVDLSQPLATLLRLSTQEAHETAERSPGATALLSGKLPREEYVKYLMMLWHVYDAFEEALDRHASQPVLEPTYNPSLLRRAPALAEDISHLLQVPVVQWQSHPIHAELLSHPPEELEAYVSRIRALADLDDPAPLLAHSYVRYLGDLSGGQTIRRIIAKAYGLNDETDGLGLKFYEFRQLRNTVVANQGEMKRIKEWFREGMNVAGDVAPQVKAAVVNEAVLAFNLNTGLFANIHLSPETETEPKANPKDKTASADKRNGISPRITKPVVPQSLYPASGPLVQMLKVTVAVCFMHLILVAGGCTGYQKLLALSHLFITGST